MVVSLTPETPDANEFRRINIEALTQDSGIDVAETGSSKGKVDLDMSLHDVSLCPFDCPFKVPFLRVVLTGVSDEMTPNWSIRNRFFCSSCTSLVLVSALPPKPVLTPATVCKQKVIYY